MKRILIFLAFTFIVTYSLEFLVIYPLVGNAGLGTIPGMTVTLTVGSMMFIPALGVLFTRLVTKEGFKGSLIKPIDFKHTYKYYLIAWFAPSILTIVGALVYYLIFPTDFDSTMSLMVNTLDAQVKAQGGASLPVEAYQTSLLVQIGVGILLAPLMNIFTCFGEEWGWRGYLLPKVNKRLSFIPTILVTGVIWGLWHAPLTALGHNYGIGYPGYPFGGILAMCCFCIVLNAFFSYLTIRAKSCLPAAIAHGAVNGFVSAALIFSLTGGNPFVGPTPVGIIGGIGFIVVAVVICITMRKEPGTWSDLSSLTVQDSPTRSS